MIIFREQKSYAIIEETQEEQLMTDIELRNECLKYLSAIRGKIFINKATGIPIEVNRELKNEMIGKIHVNVQKRRPVAHIKFLSLKVIHYFLTDSDPDTIGEPDYKNRPYIEYSHIFKYNCIINGLHYRVLIRTRKLTNSGNRLYFLNFEDLNINERGATRR
jgi:hypothetical protein